MKKFALAMMAASALVFGFGAAAQAQYGTRSVVPSTATPTTGQQMTVTITGCAPGETLTVTLNGGVVATVTCGTVASFAAPATAGTYSGVVTGNRGFAGSFSIVASNPTATSLPDTGSPVPATVAPPATVPGGGLPATGSSGTSSMTTMAIGLMVVGLGLFAVAQVRRRQPSLA